MTIAAALPIAKSFALEAVSGRSDAGSHFLLANEVEYRMVLDRVWRHARLAVLVVVA